MDEEGVTRLPDEEDRIALTKEIWENLSVYDYTKTFYSFIKIKKEAAKECGFMSLGSGTANSCPICRHGDDYRRLFSDNPHCADCALYLEDTLCEHSEEEIDYSRPYYRWHEVLGTYRLFHEDNYSEHASKQAQKAAAKLVDELKTGKPWFYNTKTYRWVRKRKECCQCE